MDGPIILSLCDRTGVWSRPYEEAGYRVYRVDITRGQDVRLLPHCGDDRVRGILAAPPCTHFARSGAPHWARKGEAALVDGLSVVDACLRAVVLYRPEWWCLENPIGRLQDYLGPPRLKCHPCDFGDPWTKRMWLWGEFNPPERRPCTGPIEVNPCQLRWGKAARSVTPEGFARAFFASNP